MTIQPIVEGRGEVEALPVLLRRILHEMEMWEVRVGRPIRVSRGKLVQETSLRMGVEMARRREDCGAVLVLIDSDGDCPAQLGPRLSEWLAAAAVPGEVVVAHREYEAWFLAAIESLRGHHGIREDAEPYPDPERPRGAKQKMTERMRDGRSYLATADQSALSARFSLSDAYRRSRSFRKLTTAVGSLVRAMGGEIAEWPPPAWTAPTEEEGRSA